MSNSWIAHIIMEDVHLKISLSQSHKSCLSLKMINSIDSVFLFGDWNEWKAELFEYF